MQKNPNDIIIFLIAVVTLILFMAGFIISMVFLYRKRQIAFEKNIEQLKLDHEKTSLNAQVEIQEQTLQHFSREIHDNIGLSLTLAKLQLNTFDWNDRAGSANKLDLSIELLSKSIAELNQLSRSMNTGQITQLGLLSAVEDELNRIRQAGLFTVDYTLTGNTIFMNAQRELVIFRIIQEGFNNIIKHAKAGKAMLHIHYNDTKLIITISDNGTGFDTELCKLQNRAGLKNMESRTKMLGGEMITESIPGKGTTLNFTIPFEQNEQ